MTPLTWRQFGNAPSSIEPATNAAINQNSPGTPPWNLRSGGGAGNGYNIELGVWQVWCAGTWHECSGTHRIHGSGHGDGGINSIFALKCFDASPTWVLETFPSGSKEWPSPTGHLDDGGENNNIYFDKLPRATHTYNLIAARGDEVWLYQPGAPWSSGTGQRPGLFRYSPKSGWRNVWQGSLTGAGITTRCMHYNATQDRIYIFPQSGSAAYFSCTNPAAGPTTVTAMYNNVGAFSWHTLRCEELDADLYMADEFTGGFGV